MHQRRFITFTWAVLAYTLVVILWGAFVRATGSGAGCGAHWPTCNGVVIPRAPATETIIEFTHRLTSGVVLLLIIWLVVWAYRAFPKGHPVRLGAMLSLVFTITEALLGAGLVRFGLVADNNSIARAVSMALHLVNTFLLLAALTLTIWWAYNGAKLRLRQQGIVGWLLGIGVVGMLVVGASGAVTALGDTLFPAESVLHGLRDDFSSAAHFLVRLRVLHPVFAVMMGLYLFMAARLISRLRPNPITERLSWIIVVLFFTQLAAGVVNVALLAPVWMQLVHLLLADIVWIAFILLAASALSPQLALATKSQHTPLVAEGSPGD